jgi:phage major head subunit gpT-like protein
MHITPSSLASTFIAFNTLFQGAMASAQPMVEPALATRIPSSGEGNVYAHMAKLLRMRKWVGDRVVQNISSKSYQLNNEQFELTVEVERKKLLDDQLGIYAPLIAEMGRQTGLWMEDLLVTALQAGNASTSLTYDGVPFFSTAHPVDPEGLASTATQSNNLTAADLTETTYDAARQAMFKFLGSDNRVLGVNPGLLVVPPQLETKAKKIVVATELAGAGTNVMAGTARILVLPQLANAATTWYLFDTSRSIKPLISQVREAPNFVAMTQPDSPNVFNRDTYVYGSSARGAAGYGLWFLAVRNSP